ncbi:MAG: site-2 protease family protein, partial [Syntrophaceticus schinkii]|nr:site-2 protease family protein [Syntrophaceticus schinkii]
DGSKILAGLLGSDEILYKLERYSMIILLVLIFSGFIGMVLFPVANVVIGFLNKIAALIASPFVGF